jgi:hypothetical protein
MTQRKRTKQTPKTAHGRRQYTDAGVRAASQGGVRLLPEDGLCGTWPDDPAAAQAATDKAADLIAGWLTDQALGVIEQQQAS